MGSNMFYYMSSNHTLEVIATGLMSSCGLAKGYAELKVPRKDDSYLFFGTNLKK